MCLQCLCLQCFDAVGWAAGRAPACKKIEWWSAGMVISLKRGADLHVAQLMPLPLTVAGVTAGLAESNGSLPPGL